MFRKSLAKYVAMSILSLMCVGSTLGQSASSDDFKAQIETLRKSMERYQDYKVAVRDLYLSTVACVHYSGEKIEHEWLVPLTADTKERPSLFGEKFLGPMEGHEPLIPKEFVHYDFHAWLFKDNPLGMFAPTNPNMSCDGFDFALLEKPTMMMPGP